MKLIKQTQFFYTNSADHFIYYSLLEKCSSPRLQVKNYNVLTFFSKFYPEGSNLGDLQLRQTANCVSQDLIYLVAMWRLVRGYPR